MDLADDYHEGWYRIYGVLALIMLMIFSQLVLVIILLSNGSIMWLSCILKNAFFHKTKNIRKCVKIGIILYSIFTYLLMPILCISIFMTLQEIRPWKKPEINEETSEETDPDFFFVGLMLISIIFIGAPAIAGVVSFLKFKSCTPKIEINTPEEESLKNDQTIELVEINALGCCCSSPVKVYPHNKSAAKCAVAHVWIFILSPLIIGLCGGLVFLVIVT